MILIGNVISFGAAVCMFLSALTHKRNMLFFLQFLDCTLLAVANLFLGSYAGVAVLLLSAVRNLLVAKEKYGKIWMIVFLVATIVLSFVTNNRGVVGLLPMIATIQYTLCSYFFKKIKGTKVSMAANTLFWAIYSLFILDFSTAVSNAVILLATVVSLWKLSFGKKEEAH